MMNDENETLIEICMRLERRLVELMDDGLAETVVFLPAEHYRNMTPAMLQNAFNNLNLMVRDREMENAPEDFADFPAPRI